MASNASFEIRRYGQVIWATCDGPFSLRTTTQYCDALRKAALPICDSPWIRVNDIRHWQLLTPESFPVVEDLMQWCESHYLTHSVNIMSNESIQTFALDKMMQDVKRRSQRHIFTSVEQALAQVTDLTSQFDAGVIQRDFYDK